MENLELCLYQLLKPFLQPPAGLTNGSGLAELKHEMKFWRVSVLASKQAQSMIAQKI